jgi:dTDP-3-amino-3,4,6-trideoxy-alpha-D-glucose transaminase
VTRIPVADPRAGFLAARDELSEVFATVLERGRYILGEEVEAFEREWAAHCETDHAVGVSSGTDALALALRAADVGPGDEVLVPAMTADATWLAVSQIGAVPVGVDIEPLRNGMDPARARAALSERTRAMVAVHLFGKVADVRGLADTAAEAGIALIEDAAQAHGARFGGSAVGGLAAMAAFSFYPTKNLAAIGDAGAVTTSDPQLAERLRQLRQYGWRTRSDAQIKGVNARLDELQAAFLRVMLPRLSRATERRRAVAGAYLEGLAGLPELELPGALAPEEHVWHLFVVRHPRRQALADALAQAGVSTAVHYAPAPPLSGAFRREGWRPGAFPVAERHAASALSLPMFPELEDSEVERVIAAVRAACGGF